MRSVKAPCAYCVDADILHYACKLAWIRHAGRRKSHMYEWIARRKGIEEKCGYF